MYLFLLKNLLWFHIFYCMELEFLPWLQPSHLLAFPLCPSHEPFDHLLTSPNGPCCSLLSFALPSLPSAWQLQHIPDNLVEWHFHWGGMRIIPGCFHMKIVPGCFLCVPSAPRLWNRVQVEQKALFAGLCPLLPASSFVIFLLARHFKHQNWALFCWIKDHCPIFTHAWLHFFLEEDLWIVGRIPGGRSGIPGCI